MEEPPPIPQVPPPVPQRGYNYGYQQPQQQPPGVTQYQPAPQLPKKQEEEPVPEYVNVFFILIFRLFKAVVGCAIAYVVITFLTEAFYQSVTFPVFSKAYTEYEKALSAGGFALIGWCVKYFDAMPLHVFGAAFTHFSWIAYPLIVVLNMIGPFKTNQDPKQP